jgi:hypothetical protein
MDHGMTLTPDVYNQFTTSLVERIVERALGQDPASQRLLDIRPADHVLAGFLTPLRPPTESKREDEASEESDLPQDSPYEQSSFGLEWLVPKGILQSAHKLYVTVELSVYLRRLPTYEEQREHLGWSKAEEHGEQVSAILPLWTREDLPPLHEPIDLADLLRTGSLKRSLAVPFAQALAVQLKASTDLYPGARQLAITQTAFTPEGYARWTADLQAKQSGRARYDWEPCLDVRVVPFPTDPTCVRLSLRLINRTRGRTSAQTEFFDPNLYAVRLRVHVPKAAHTMMEFADLPHSYRYDRTIAAVGINADVAVETSDEDSYLFTTQTIPWRRVDRLEPRETQQTAPLFRSLQKDPIPLLRRIHEAMLEYDRLVWQAKIDALPDSQREEAIHDRRRFKRDEIEAFERGIALLENPAYPLVRQAFGLMNEVMERVGAGKYDRWRLFQIVFIVIQLPRLTARQYSELEKGEDNDKEDEKVDILWFAAGGGKTEAFLGLLVWQLFFDRLRGKEVGVTALARFPLRLLTFQQLQRLARVLAQAEIIRSRERLGRGRFSLGYFVGDNTRPNSIDNDRDARYRANGPDPSLRSLIHCPFCQSPVVLHYNQPLRLIEHHCSEKATCPGGQFRLPIYIVDTDIYRYLPSVIVSTIDKLALIGQNPRFGNLFGRFNLYCAKHGASFYAKTDDTCKAAQAWAQLRDGKPVTLLTTCEGAPVLYRPFVDPAPALHIQDELHLLSEETGVFDSHYETAALAIMRSLGHRPWKIIAATATIENFEHHACHLYLRGARQFPCPGPGAYESFYYQVNPEKIGRIFVGVLGVGRKHTPAVTRLLSLVYQELQTARDEVEKDLQHACERYQLPTLSREEFDLLVFYYELVLTYVLTRKGSDQVTEAIQSRVVKELRELMPNHGELLLETLNGGVDMVEMIETMEQIELAQKEGEPSERIRGVVATNIISHGVDVNRFNVIVFGGFTRLVAEYIQASARVGRTFPGISFLVVTPQSERDRSIFQRFGKFHEYIDRLIDPSAINRWPMQALERTVPGVLAGYLMIVAAQQLNRQLDTLRRVQQALGEENAACLNPSTILAWMRAAFGVEQAPYERYGRELERIVRNRYAQIIDAAPEQLQGWDGIRNVLEPMRSLRDVDDPAFIGVRDEDAALLRSLLRS